MIAFGMIRDESWVYACEVFAETYEENLTALCAQYREVAVYSEDDRRCVDRRHGSGSQHDGNADL